MKVPGFLRCAWPSFLLALAAGMALPGAGCGQPAAIPPAAAPARSPDSTPPAAWSYEEWAAACARLPANRALQGRLPPASVLPLPRFADIAPLFDAFHQQSRTGLLASRGLWVGRAASSDTLLNPAAAWFMSPRVPFEPFAQKLLLAPGDEVFLHGDFHGDVHSLNACLAWLNARGYLEGFQIPRTNFHMIFLGDYTDRGLYGTEVLYVLLRLKLANPERVWLMRGNHEEAEMIAQYGFLAEARAKYGASLDAVKVARIFDYLPVVLYLGCADSFAQVNHGGMEPGYNPRPLLQAPGPLRFHFLGDLNQRQFLESHAAWPVAPEERALAGRVFQNFTPLTPTKPMVLGFMWNDFTVTPSEPQLAIDPGRALVYGDRATRYLLEAASGPSAAVRVVFRAHQHSSVLNPLMRRLIEHRGAYPHWTTEGPALNRQSETPLEDGDERLVPEGSVWTFNVSPDSVYGQGCGYGFDTIGLLRVGPRFADWRLRVVNLAVNPPVPKP